MIPSLIALQTVLLHRHAGPPPSGYHPEPSRLRRALKDLLGMLATLGFFVVFIVGFMVSIAGLIMLSWWVSALGLAVILFDMFLFCYWMTPD